MENYNLIGYAIYLPITFYITIWVGWMCYKNGEQHLYRVFNGDMHLVKPTNKLLLTGYYLLNLGYATVVLSLWETLDTPMEVVNSLSQKLGFIILSLGLMHYFNLWATGFIAKRILHTNYV